MTTRQLEALPFLKRSISLTLYGEVLASVPDGKPTFVDTTRTDPLHMPPYVKWWPTQAIRSNVFTVNMAAEAGACSFDMVAADGTFIEAPSSTKNKAHARDPEMASGKKANTWHFGMKEHIAACSESGIIYGTVAAPANEHDITHFSPLTIRSHW